ncbi:hypothetical protein LguiA_031882 [Lonicera macranthoides]
MAEVDIRDGKGRLSAPILILSARLLSAIIRTHKNWLTITTSDDVLLSLSLSPPSPPSACSPGAGEHAEGGDGGERDRERKRESLAGRERAGGVMVVKLRCWRGGDGGRRREAGGGRRQPVVVMVVREEEREEGDVAERE